MTPPPTHARIDLGRLGQNVETIRRHLAPSTRIMAVVKADSYGHSAAICAPELLRHGIDMFAVASIEEGIELRRIGIEARILVIRPPVAGQHDLYAGHDLEAMISTAANAVDLDAAAAANGRQLRVHLYVDTGMARNGANPAEVNDLLRTIDTLPMLRLQGIASHFATSDDLQSSFAAEQISIFRAVVGSAADAGFAPEDIHMANSGGIFNHPDSHFSMVRPGISLYGYHPTESLQAESGLLPVMSVRTVVGGVKRIGPGLSVSYGRTHYTSAGTRVATLPIGYADGLPRSLSNRYEVLIDGRRYRGIGTICMDEVMIDLEESQVDVGSEVIILGESGTGKIDAWELAGRSGTIPWEICTGIGGRVPRVAVHDADTGM